MGAFKADLLFSKFSISFVCKVNSAKLYDYINAILNCNTF